jgi:thioredoxin 1
MAPTIGELADEFAGRAKVAKLNVIENGNLAQKYNIQGVPTILIFRNGEVVNEIVGGRPKVELVDKLNLAINP